MKHEQTIENHVDANVAMAIDQAEVYGGMEEAKAAFSQNVMDSVLDDGYTGQQALDAASWFERKITEQV